MKKSRRGRRDELPDRLDSRAPPNVTESGKYFNIYKNNACTEKSH